MKKIVVILLCVWTIVLLAVQFNTKKNSAAETPTMATEVDATSSKQQKSSAATDMQLPT